MSEEKITGFSGITDRGYELLHEAIREGMQREREFLSQYIEVDEIPEPQLSLLLRAMEQRRLDLEREGRFQSIAGLRKHYLKDPESNSHYRRVLVESYPYVLCGICDAEPRYFDPYDPESASMCKDHSSLLENKYPYSTGPKFSDE